MSRPPCVVTLHRPGAEPEEREAATVDAAVALARRLLEGAGDGARATVARAGLETRYYAVSEAGTVRRMPHPGGRPPLPPAERRQLVAVRLAPATLTALDALGEQRSETRTQTVERLVLEAVSP